MQLNELNPQQQAAVRHTQGPLLVLAGAGSGKTRVITTKIMWLIRQQGIAPEQIIAVTFTNKAAREMKARVNALMQKQNEVLISTFHHLGLTILQRDIKALAYKNNFSILDPQDCQSLLKELGQKGEKINADLLNFYQGQISFWKNNLITPDQAMQQVDDEKSEEAAYFYDRYQSLLKSYNALDFDDLILLPVQLFKAHPEVLMRWQNKLRYLLVDEYQDTNYCQYELVKLLAGKQATFTVVGDDDQSIYAWRGARPENLAQLAQDYPQLTVIKLEQNYRSSNAILSAANHLIAHNPHVFNKKLWSDKGRGQTLRIIVTQDEQKEAERVVSELLKHQFQHRTAYQDYAVLYRSNHQAKIFETLFRQHQIPYQLSGGTSFFSRAEIKDIMSYLRLLVNPRDDAAFLRIANVPRRELGSNTLQKLSHYAQQRHASLFQASFEVGLAQQLTENSYQRLQKFTRWLGYFSERSQKENPALIARELIADIGYEQWLLETCSDKRTAARRMQNIEELIDWLQRLQQEQGKNLSDILNHFMLSDILEKQNEEKTQLGVSMMTLHAAKGLEFPYVFLVGMEENILPHYNSQDNASLEEERRLAYVGITRAQKWLIMTLAKRRKRHSEFVICEPSRFLQELPQNEVQWEGHGFETKISESERKATGTAYLNQLRQLLAK
ncbi:UvrD-helicase domain-containing protein [Thioflexithrix psekupsensis]|uniref:ATP-dependent DNA helicase Rep n=1 Tax=Thioflexithrix psekupsensis TaxID=1570016 RepID=A0A251X5H3_9GAMM|nr:UvrD-helicase domain-containing protein [Thioflexithrix psekupsensis]OUD12908.1 ATP-dependent DNA helicase Rep [Thioflexithrix psekupsensis]